MDLEGKVQVTLKVIKGPEQGKTFEFTGQDNFLLGRDASGSKAHFRLSSKDQYVSRNHLLLEINPPDCYLRDTGSLNGTFVIRVAKVVFYLEGRKEREWTGNAKSLMDLYQCESYQKTTNRFKLEDNDIVNVGDTFIELRIIQDIPAPSQKAERVEIFRCVQCGKEITGEINGREGGRPSSTAFLCEECSVTQKKHARDLKKETIKCWGCSKDLTSIANSDGRAGEIRDIALYWCTDCASSNQEDVPISKVYEYHILKELGSGGFGVVYLAWHEQTDRLVALKLTKEKVKRNNKLLQRFKREISIMRTLRHPNLVRLYDDGVTEDENYYFVSEYLPDGSLSDYLNKEYSNNLPYGKACYFISRALEGLSFLHNYQEKYVHRDLKLENILLRKSENGIYEVKIGDFGLAKSYVLHGGTITKEGEWAGTLFYCPPEQIIAFRDVKPYTDVYAIGMTLYYLIAGQFPYHFPSRREMLELISQGKKIRDPIDIILGEDRPIPVEERVAGIPKGLSEAVNKAIDKEASRRFDSADKFRNSIERYATCG